MSGKKPKKKGKWMKWFSFAYNPHVPDKLVRSTPDERVERWRSRPRHEISPKVRSSMKDMKTED